MSTKPCKGCGRDFIASAARRHYCDDCRKPRNRSESLPAGLQGGPGIGYSTMSHAEWQRIEPFHAEVAKRIKEHNVEPRPALFTRRVASVIEAYEARDNSLLKAALADLAATCTQWGARRQAVTRVGVLVPVRRPTDEEREQLRRDAERLLA